MRILIYTGKGGVGKTSIAAATALRLSAQGKRVLVMSTDQAHSLSDSFAISLGPSPVKVAECLYALEIDPVVESARAWGKLRDYLKEIIRGKAEGGLEEEEVLLFPGLDELFSLLKILEAVESDQYDVILADCAPTGETLSLLRYPERLSVLADKLLPPVRNFNNVLGGLVSRKTTVPKPRDEVFSEFEALNLRLSRLREVLTDRSVTSIRLVLTPERIVYEETKRSYSWIRAFDYGVDAVYLNRIYPEQALVGYFSGWAVFQEEMIGKVKETFSAVRIFYLMMQSEELKGPEMLARVASELYSGSDPSEIFALDHAFSLEDEGAARFLILDLPYAESRDIDVEREGRNLILAIRNERRIFPLPDRISRRTLTGWTFEKGKLRIRFEHE